MPTSRALILPLVAVLALACGPKRLAYRPAEGGFPKASYEENWQRALDALEARGYSIQISDRSRGILGTQEVELQVPCRGEQSCLARQSIQMRIRPDGKASVSIARKLWSSVTRQFAPPAETDVAGMASLERDQELLLKEILGEKTAGSRGADGDLCEKDDQCAEGRVCAQRRCYRGCSDESPCPPLFACTDHEDGVCRPVAQGASDAAAE
ncbi:hypothetical protein [Anaeromyxobacter paludicola]|uniref:Lipoprotein n=1 Tax=Anaeromyxobacter paludicola TaxID=2918171 RepID=A0ABM7XAN3_9BACT|nr:hypothetical protein [Anaeromyxobacter paludicola]BDG08904.1 hypothetical protein AMPC_20170 [Anaeromyxobacter paludicola]